MYELESRGSTPDGRRARRRRTRRRSRPQRYLQLDGTVPEPIRDVAAEATAGAGTARRHPHPARAVPAHELQLRPRRPARALLRPPRAVPYPGPAGHRRAVRRRLRRDGPLARVPGPGRRRLPGGRGDRRRPASPSSSSRPPTTTPGSRCASPSSAGSPSTPRPRAGTTPLPPDPQTVAPTTVAPAEPPGQPARAAGGRPSEGLPEPEPEPAERRRSQVLRWAAPWSRRDRRGRDRSRSSRSSCSSGGAAAPGARPPTPRTVWSAPGTRSSTAWPRCASPSRPR